MPETRFQIPLFAPRRETLDAGICMAPPVRHFTDLVGERWRVCERTFGGISGTHPVPALVFESNAVVRRVQVFPRDWADLGDRELEALSWAR